MSRDFIAALLTLGHDLAELLVLEIMHVQTQRIAFWPGDALDFPAPKTGTFAANRAAGLRPPFDQACPRCDDAARARVPLPDFSCERRPGLRGLPCSDFPNRACGSCPIVEQPRLHHLRGTATRVRGENMK